MFLLITFSNLLNEFNPFYKMNPQKVNKTESLMGVDDELIALETESRTVDKDGKRDRNGKRKRSKEEKFKELRVKLNSNDRFKVVLASPKPGDSWVRKFAGYLVNIRGLRVVDKVFCLVCFCIEQDSEFVTADQLREVTFFEEGTAITNVSAHLTGTHGFIKENQPYNHALLANIKTKGTRVISRHARRPTATQAQFNYLLTLLIICCHLSIELVDHPIFRELLALIAPQYSVPSRQTLTSTHLTDVWSYNYLQISELIAKTPFNTLFVCVDIWLCKPKSVSFICFNGHFFSEHHNRVIKVTLRFQELQMPHNQKHILELINNLIKEFNLNTKRLVFNTDEGSNIVGATSNFERLSCVGHILHNFVADWVKLDPNFRRVLRVSKDIIHFFRFHMEKARDFYSGIDRLAEFQRLDDEVSSMLNEEEFEDEYSNFDLEEQQTDQQTDRPQPTDSAHQMNSQQLDQLPDRTNHSNGKPDQKPTKATKFPKDCLTRWNMKHDQLNSVLRHKDCIVNVLQKYLQHSLLPSDDDWKLLGDYVDLLLHIKSISIELSGDEPNASLVISCEAQLKSKIDSNASLDETLKGQLKATLNRRWKINDDYLAAALLDPLFKDGRNAEYHLEKRGQSKRAFLLQYAEQHYNLKSLQQQPESSVQPSTTTSFSRSSLSLRESGVDALVSSDWIDDYFSYTPTQCDRGMDLLTWWKANKSRYPFVYQLACELFAMRTTQVSSESTFSKSGLRMIPNRSNTSGPNLEKMIFVETNRKVVEEFCASDQRHGSVTGVGSETQQSAESAALPSAGSCEHDLRLQVEQINKQNLDRTVDYSQKLKKLKTESAKKEYEKAKKQLTKSKAGELTRAGPSNELVDEVKAARIRELKAVIESKVVHEQEVEKHETANDEFTELARLDPTHQIGPQKHNIVCNNQFIGNFEIVACMEFEIKRLGLTDCIVLHGELLTNEGLLIQRLNEGFQSNMNRIFLPVNLNRNHWILLYLNLNANRSMIFDSALKEDSVYADTFQKAFRLLQLIFLRDSRIWRTEQHRFTIVHDLPQQPEASLECGVYCFNFFQFIVNPAFNSRRFEIHPNFRRFEMNQILKVFNPKQTRETRQSTKGRTNMMRLAEKDLTNLEQPDIQIVYLEFAKI